MRDAHPQLFVPLFIFNLCILYSRILLSYFTSSGILFLHFISYFSLVVVGVVVVFAFVSVLITICHCRDSSGT